jgi:hypothetical protein
MRNRVPATNIPSLVQLNTKREDDIRKSVHTGASVSGFNLSSNVPLNWFLNSLISKRPARIRNSYSLRTICATCEAKLDAQERARVKAIFWAAGVVIALVAVFLSLSMMHK